MEATESSPFHLDMTSEPLNVSSLVEFVSHPSAGAISSFIGVTRDNFQGKRVIRLEYEAYIPMALKKMEALCKEACERWEVKKIAMVHRIGNVAVGEASVIIVISSPHRKASLEAVSWAIDELKLTVPIWKLEVYDDGSEWKENPR